MLPLETAGEGSYCIISRNTAPDPHNVSGLECDVAFVA